MTEDGIIEKDKNTLLKGTVMDASQTDEYVEICLRDSDGAVEVMNINKKSHHYNELLKHLEKKNTEIEDFLEEPYGTEIHFFRPVGLGDSSIFNTEQNCCYFLEDIKYEKYFFTNSKMSKGIKTSSPPLKDILYGLIFSSTYVFFLVINALNYDTYLNVTSSLFVNIAIFIALVLIFIIIFLLFLMNIRDVFGGIYKIYLINKGKIYLQPNDKYSKVLYKYLY